VLTLANEKEAEKAKAAAQKAAKKEKRKQSRAKIANFFADVKSEFKKITWPELKSTRNKTILVILAIIISGFIIYGFDQLMLFLVGFAVKQA